MKKYWQLMLIAVFIAATISIHYIQVANATKIHSNFTFETISGDDSYLDSLVLEATVGSRMNKSQQLLIEKDVTTAVKHLRYRYTPLVFEELINEHKNFMRGKAFNANNYYEDDTKLIYVKEPYDTWNINKDNTYRYEIDVLDKVENKKSSFEVESKLPAEFNWSAITNVTVVNNELKIIIRHGQHNGDEKYYMETIDLKTEQLVGDRLIESVTNDQLTRAHITFYNDYYRFTHEKYYVYSVDKYEIGMEQDSLISRQFNVLNIETNEVTPIPSLEGLDLEIQGGVVDQNYFIKTRLTDTDTYIYRYNIGQQRWLEPVVVPQPMKFINKEFKNYVAQNGKFYVLNQTEKDYLLQIFDIESGATLYEGILSNNDAKQKYSLWVNRFHEVTE